MGRARIVERTGVDGNVTYVIQTRHWPFWWWVDAWVNRDPHTIDTFSTLEAAKANLCYFDGSVPVDKVVVE